MQENASNFSKFSGGGGGGACPRIPLAYSLASLSRSLATLGHFGHYNNIWATKMKTLVAQTFHFGPPAYFPEFPALDTYTYFVQIMVKFKSEILA